MVYNFERVEGGSGSVPGTVVAVEVSSFSVADVDIGGCVAQ